MAQGLTLLEGSNTFKLPRAQHGCDSGRPVDRRCSFVLAAACTEWHICQASLGLLATCQAAAATYLLIQSTVHYALALPASAWHSMTAGYIRLLLMMLLHHVVAKLMICNASPVHGFDTCTSMGPCNGDVHGSDVYMFDLPIRCCPVGSFQRTSLLL